MAQPSDIALTTMTLKHLFKLMYTAIYVFVYVPVRIADAPDLSIARLELHAPFVRQRAYAERAGHGS